MNIKQSVDENTSKRILSVNFIILILGFLFMSCESKKTNNPTKTIAILDTIDQQTSFTNSVKQASKITEVCDCPDFEKSKRHNPYNPDLIFYNHYSKKNKQDSIFNIYSTDSLRLTVKSIYFSCFDTIPKKFAVFKNVEHIVIGEGNLFGLDMFPDLKYVSFWSTLIEVNSSEKWLSRIEGIYAEKSFVKGLLTFKTTPNLKEIVFAHSRLEPFPSDFDKLKCLRRITLEAHRGNIDLSQIDLSLNPCIEQVEFNTYYNAFSGIPQGLDTNRTFELIINHQKLTKEEKEIIKTFNKKTKKNRFLEKNTFYID